MEWFCIDPAPPTKVCVSDASCSASVRFTSDSLMLWLHTSPLPEIVLFKSLSKIQ